MNNSILKAYDLLQDIICIIDEESLEIVYINKVGIEKFGKLRKKQKCYEYFYNFNNPCKNCPYAIGETCLKDKTIGHYHSRRTIIEICNKKYILIVLYDTEDIENKVINNKDKALYEKLLSGMSDVNIEDKIEAQIKHTLVIIKDIFKAKSVTLLRKPKTKDFPTITVKDDDYKDFVYNPIMKTSIYNDDEISDELFSNNYVLIETESLKEKYPSEYLEIRNDGITNFGLMIWNIDDYRFDMVIENYKIDVEDERVYKVIYSYLLFALKSFLYNQGLYRLSNKDLLTNLYNRNKYNNDMQEYSKNTHDRVGVLFLDLDKLKVINDSFGHTHGDKLIRDTSSVLKECFDFADIYRMGGDEFIVIAKNCEFIKFNNAAIKLRNLLGEQNIFASYGICYEQIDAIISNMVDIAENEMYIYKRKNHEEYNFDIQKEKFINDFREEVKQGKYFILLQSKMNPYTNEISGAEALIRYQGESKIEYPNSFIPLFEKNNCIDLLDYFMIEHVCMIQKTLKEQYHKIVPISVNISKSTLLMNHFEKYLINTLNKYGLNHEDISLEITERSNVSSEDILLYGSKIQKHGIVLEIDNFGTSFTNLSFINANVFSVLKIDRSLICHLIDNEITYKLIDFVIEECHKKNILILAEGVELESEMNLVKKLGVDLVQGYYYEKPMLVVDFEKKYYRK